MGMLFSDGSCAPGGRPRGFDRYRRTLEGNWKRFFLVDFLTLVALVPFAAGVFYAVLLSSVAVLFTVSIAGGLLAGPAISGMVDCIFRALRGVRDDWWVSYKRAWRQNWRGSLLPGVLFCLFLGFYTFMCLIMYNSTVRPGAGTVAMLLAGFVFATAIFLTYWSQLVLFEQKITARLKNCLFFCIKYFWRTMGVAVLNLAWWAATVLFMPWTAFVVPFLGVWYIWFLSFHLLYDQLDESFELESRIFEKFPEQKSDGS